MESPSAKDFEKMFAERRAQDQTALRKTGTVIVSAAPSSGKSLTLGSMLATNCEGMPPASSQS